MPSHINDHAPVGASVAVPSAFLDKIHDLLAPIHAHAVASLEDRDLPADSAPSAPALSESQFNDLVELLRPGYELAKLLLEERLKAQHPIVLVPREPATPVQVEQVSGERSASEQSSG